MPKQKLSASARRSASRLAAVQALYQRELTEAGTERVLGEFLRFRLGDRTDDDEQWVEPDRALFAAIVRGVDRRGADIDPIVTQALGPQWSFDRLEVLLRVILRAGVWELLENRDAETRIVIAEYIDLTDAFFVGREAGMVNAVLDRVGRSVRDDADAGQNQNAADDRSDDAPVSAAPAGRAIDASG